MKNVLVITSGGMDSTVLLHQHVKQGDVVEALAIDYGQRHCQEINFAMKQARSLKVPIQVADLHALRELLPGSSQTDPTVSVPKGHYQEESMKQTVVPNRNMILLAVALGHAIAHKLDFVSYAAHAGDHAIYPDCRKEFVDAFNTAAALCDWRKMEILSPFVNKTKADIVTLGTELGVDFSQTWSCYVGGTLHCGECGTCVERREAFQLAGVKDPTVYL